MKIDTKEELFMFDARKAVYSVSDAWYSSNALQEKALNHVKGSVDNDDPVT